jgi:hypothetical protein
VRRARGAQAAGKRRWYLTPGLRGGRRCDLLRSLSPPWRLARGLPPTDGLTREEVEHAAGEFLAGLVAALEELGYRSEER